jgi:hypothetical protein
MRAICSLCCGHNCRCSKGHKHTLYYPDLLCEGWWNCRGARRRMTAEAVHRIAKIDRDESVVMVFDSVKVRCG